MSVELGARLLQLLAVILAVILAKRQASYRSLVWFLGVTFAAGLGASCRQILGIEEATLICPAELANCAVCIDADDCGPAKNGLVYLRCNKRKEILQAHANSRPMFWGVGATKAVERRFFERLSRAVCDAGLDTLDVAIGSDGKLYFAARRKEPAFVGVAENQHRTYGAAIREFISRTEPRVLAPNGMVYLQCCTPSDILRAKESGRPMFWGSDMTSARRRRFVQRLSYAIAVTDRDARDSAGFGEAATHETEGAHVNDDGGP